MLRRYGSPAMAGKCLLAGALLWSAGVSLHAKSPVSRVEASPRTIVAKAEKGTPHEINYQGWLGDKGDTAGVTGDLDMTFRLYDARTAGSVLWNETQDGVAVNKGIFNVLLGSITPLPANIFTGDPLWLETQVESDTLSPRKKLVSVGYAMKSENADNAIYADTAGYALSGVGANGWTLVGNDMYSAVSGNVGIGVSGPTEKLDIDGAVNVSSFYKIEGDRILSSNAGNGNIFVGVGAGEDNTTGNKNTFSGYQAGYSNTTGNNNTFSGYKAGISNTGGDNNTFTGLYAGYNNTTGRSNTFSGYQAGYENTTGDNNTFTGYVAGTANTTGNNNTFTGYRAGNSNITGNSNVFIGYQAGYNETGSNKLYIANDSSDTNVLIYGEFDNRRVGIGTTSPTERLDVSGNINTSTLYKIGGDKVLSNPGVGNIFVGAGAGESTTSNYNTFLGSNSGNSNISGLANTFLGCTAGYANIGGYRNTFLGIGAGGTNTGGHENTLMGSWAGYSNTTGNSNVFVGFRAGYYETGSDKLYIANDSTNADVLIYGEFDNRRVGIGTTSPTANLDINGVDGYNQLRMRVSFTPTATDDARGNTGDIAWDDDCIYIKTSGGWKRAALSTF